MYLLDTNVISEIRKANHAKCSPLFKAWFDNTDLKLCYLSSITMFKIERGILQKAQKDKVWADIIRQWFEYQVKPEFKGRILSLDTPSALKIACFHVPNPVPLADGFLAGIAINHEMILVTRNTKDFIGFHGIKLLNPFE